MGSGKQACGKRLLVDAGDILVLDDLAVPLPVFAVLERAALEVAGTSVEEHTDEEDGVEVGDDGRGADDGAPGETHGPVGDVVGFAGVGPEAAGQKTVSKRMKSVLVVFEIEMIGAERASERTHEQSG